MEFEPSFYTVIPSKVRYCDTISDRAKIVYAELNAITFSNQLIASKNGLHNHFEKYLQMSGDEVESALEELKMNCFLQFDLAFDGRRIITIK